MKNKIKSELKSRGITQKQLAEAIGMSEVGLSNAINGSATMQTIERIANHWGISTTELIDNPISVKFSGEINLGDIIIPCYVLEDGRRVLSGRGLQESLRMTDDNKSASGHRLMRYLNQKTLNPFIFKDKDPGHFSPIECYNGEQKINGYEASVLIDICDGILEARRFVTLSPRQSIIAERCEILVRSFAKVGLIALIDEATGYNKEKSRAKDELQRILATFLNEEASKWVKTFPDSFFEMIYKMRNWNWTNTSKRPGVVGKWINDIVYERIAPQLLQELQTRNPKNENGNRNHCHHQFLTEELGQPKLREHISGVMAIGRLSDNNWERFMRNLDKAFPRQYAQLELDFDFED